MAINVLALLLFAGLLVAGLVIVTVAAHGRWTVDVPRCAACGQRVGDGEYERSGRCPECGFDVAAPRGVTYFRRRIRFGMCAVGVGIGLLAFAAPLVLSIARNRTLGLTLGPASPTSALVASLRNREESAGYVALIEAERRVRAGEVSVADLDQLVDAILAWSESNDSNYLETNAESVIAAAKAKGIDVDTRLLALADTLLGAPLSDVPESVREGVDRELPLRLPVSQSAGSLGRTLAAATLTVDGAPVELGARGLDLGPGEHALEVRITGAVTLMGGPTSGVAIQVPFDRTFRRRLRVVPADAPPILPTFDAEAFEPTARACVSVQAVAIDYDSSSGRCVVRVDIVGDRNVDPSNLPGLPPGGAFALAYDVVLVIDTGDATTEYPVGSRTLHLDTRGSSASARGGATAIPCPPADARVRVVLRPTPRAAESAETLVAKVPVYTREIAIEPPVLRNGRAAGKGEAP